MRSLLAFAMMVLPARFRRVFARRVLRWNVHPTASIGRSMIVVPDVTLGPGATIGPRNVIKGLRQLRMGEGAIIASRNWITGFPPELDSAFLDSPGRDPRLVMGPHSMITVGHEIDCTDGVVLEEHATIAGFRCQVLTHSLNLVTDRQATSPVVIGAHAAVMSGCILLSGTGVPPRSIVSAGSVVTTKLTTELTFYRGNPAQAVRPLPERLRYFHRGEPGFNPTQPRG